MDPDDYDDLLTKEEIELLTPGIVAKINQNQNPLLDQLIFPKVHNVPKCTSCTKWKEELKLNKRWVNSLADKEGKAKLEKAEARKTLTSLKARAKRESKQVDRLKGEINSLKAEIEKINEKIKDEQKQNWRKANYINRHGLYLTNDNCLICLCSLKFYSKDHLYQHIVRRVDNYKEQAVCSICYSQCATTWEGYKEHVVTVHKLMVEE